mgnify:CR=1 FL=1
MVELDFRNTVIVDFDLECDRVEDVPARVARQLFLMTRSRHHGPD